MQPQYLANPAANSIAPDRTAQRLLHTPAEPCEIEAIGAKKNGELAARPPAALLVHCVVLDAMQEAVGARKIEPRRVRRA